MFFDDDDFLRAFEKEVKKMMKIIDRMMRDMESAQGTNAPIMHGIRITIGPDGIPKIEEFGNVHVEEGEPKVVEYREPLSDVHTLGDKVIVTVELPGADEKSIRVKVDGQRMIVDADGEFRYRKLIRLPFNVKKEKAKITFKNGILEVQLERGKSRPFVLRVTGQRSNDQKHLSS